MMRMIVKSLAVAGLLAASPALALTKAQADCPAQTAPASLARNLVNAVMDDKTSDADVGALLDQLDQVAKTCSGKTNVPVAQREVYSTFVLDVLVRDELVSRLTAAGVPMDALNAVLGYGPGLPTKAYGDLNDAKIAEIDRALSAKGFSLANAPVEVYGLIGIYTGAQDGLVEDLAELN